MASAVRRTRGDHQMIRFLFVLAALASGTGALLFPARAAHAQDMINNLPDYTGAWLMADLMQRRGRDPEEESRKPAKEDRKMEEPDRQEAAKPPAPDAETILRQAAYVPSAEVGAALDDAFAGFLAGQRPDASSPGLLRALAQDNPAGSPFLDLLAGGLGGGDRDALRSEEHTSELQSLMRISYAVFCLKKKKRQQKTLTRLYRHKH